ncbi:MAG: phosphonate C-P lyase system protein PhnL [Deltaproteobacteria bacterium]|nr:phosphonate C-P lyase system protein PhnL [Deltaproteobacteria bacterium]
MEPMIVIDSLRKSFFLHLQGGVTLSVLKKISLEVKAGECLALCGPSGSGKSTLVRLLYANYKARDGKILVRHQGQWVDMVKAELRKVLEIRKLTIGYVSQFLRVIPRIPALDVVMEPLQREGIAAHNARRHAEDMLTRLNIPQRLWGISPTTFSGGEQQRINIARSFIKPYPILLLDEPTAALDATNRRVVVELIQDAKERGAAIVGVFHDEEVRDAVSTCIFEMTFDGGQA